MIATKISSSIPESTLSFCIHAHFWPIDEASQWEKEKHHTTL
jgi:hypothetical protein